MHQTHSPDPFGRATPPETPDLAETVLAYRAAVDASNALQERLRVLSIQMQYAQHEADEARKEVDRTQTALDQAGLAGRKVEYWREWVGL